MRGEQTFVLVEKIKQLVIQVGLERDAKNSAEASKSAFAAEADQYKAQLRACQATIPAHYAMWSASGPHQSYRAHAFAMHRSK